MNEIKKIAELLKERVPNKTWQPKVLAEEIYDMICKDKVIIPEKITKNTSSKDLVKIVEYNEKIRKQTIKGIINKIIWFAVKRIGQTNSDSYYQISFDLLNKLAKEYEVEIE